MEQVTVKLYIAERLFRLPKKMNMYRHSDVLPECVLWELAHDFCLRFKYAAYFVYNPDFHLCKGVAGIKKEEITPWSNESEPWHNIQEFENYIKDTGFNKNIKKIQYATQPNSTPELVAQELKEKATLPEPSYTIWHLKNDNFGILLHETYDQEKQYDDAEIENAVEYLSFCKF